MQKLFDFLNSGFGLVLAGAVVGVFGLFTWQRLGWLFKQKYLREQIMLDRKIALIERINADVGALVADADSVIAVIVKKGSPNQRTQIIEAYNEEQAKWFGLSASYQALLGFYFPDQVAAMFMKKVIGATQDLDVRVSLFSRQATDQSQKAVYKASHDVRSHLQVWNKLAMGNLQSD
jgi:hypothetical protein